MARISAPNVLGVLQKALLRLEPEKAHSVAMGLLGHAHRHKFSRSLLPGAKPDPRLSVNIGGMQLASPLGLAAGFDKGAEAFNALLALGFSHVEVGTVTPKPQVGNESPRIERWRDHKALVNRMGFPGPGMDAVVARLQDYAPVGVVGINIGPNKDTDATEVAASLQKLASRLSAHAQYLAINVSSPNTPGLRDLQTPAGVANLVAHCIEGAKETGAGRPVWVKLHPDAPADKLVEVAKAAVEAGAAGIIAVNTTTERVADMGSTMEGGMSGAPLFGRALATIRSLHSGLDGEVPIIGVGGVFTGNDAYEMIRAGAGAVQTYTGFIYRGPGMPKRVQSELLACLDRDGLDNIREATGAN